MFYLKFSKLVQDRFKSSALSDVITAYLSSSVRFLTALRGFYLEHIMLLLSLCSVVSF